jgi:hypothetical protein
MTAPAIRCRHHPCVFVAPENAQIRHTAIGAALIFTCPGAGHDHPVVGLLPEWLVPHVRRLVPTETYDIPELADPILATTAKLTPWSVERWTKLLAPMERLAALSAPAASPTEGRASVMTDVRATCPIHGDVKLDPDWVKIRPALTGPTLEFTCPRDGHDRDVTVYLNPEQARLIPALRHVGVKVVRDIVELADPIRATTAKLTERGVERWVGFLEPLQAIVALPELADVRADVARDLAGGL